MVGRHPSDHVTDFRNTYQSDALITQEVTMRRFVLLCVALTMTATLSACADHRHRHYHGAGTYDRPGMRGEGMMNGRPDGMMGPGAMGGGPRGY